MVATTVFHLAYKTLCYFLFTESYQTTFRIFLATRSFCNEHSLLSTYVLCFFYPFASILKSKLPMPRNADLVLQTLNACTLLCNKIPYFFREEADTSPNMQWKIRNIALKLKEIHTQITLRPIIRGQNDKQSIDNTSTFTRDIPPKQKQVLIEQTEQQKTTLPQRSPSRSDKLH